MHDRVRPYASTRQRVVVITFATAEDAEDWDDSPQLADGFIEWEAVQLADTPVVEEEHDAPA